MMLKKKKGKKVGKIGIANIHTTFSNTIVTICDLLGNTLCWSSSGTSGFKGARKKTPFAAQLAARYAGTKALELGMEKVEVVIKGRGSGRETSIRALKSAGLGILSIQDQTSIPHNGCRPPKKRRLYFFQIPEKKHK
jgi:small subunit ribosomal protein S11